MSIEVVSLLCETEEFQRLIAQKDAEIARLSAHLKVLQEQLNLLTAKRFGASSEKAHPDQIRLFNEAELEAVAPIEEEQATIEIPAHRRRPSGRKPLGCRSTTDTSVRCLFWKEHGVFGDADGTFIGTR